MPRGKPTGAAAAAAGELEIRVGNRFRVLEKLGGGSFGDIYKGVNILTGEQVAIKLEPLGSKIPQLLPEARLAKLLGILGPKGVPELDAIGVPRVHWYGIEGDFNVMVIDQLGPSLEDLFQFAGRHFPVGAVAGLGVQLVSRVELVHSRHLLHRDIKPDNFLAGLGKRASLIYIIDFGLAKVFRDPKTLEHIPYRVGKSFSGTQRYASVHSHLGVEQSRRDDLEAVGYIMLYFLRGSLPWQGLREKEKTKKADQRYEVPKEQAAKKPQQRKNVGKPEISPAQKEALQRQQRIADKKLSTSFEDLCKGFPSEFKMFLQYSNQLGFDAKPDYDYLRDLLEKAGQKALGRTASPYEWLQLVQKERERGPKAGKIAVATADPPMHPSEVPPKEEDSPEDGA